PTGTAEGGDKLVYATCYIGETDVNEAMVRSGWARAVRDQTDRYEVDEVDAKESRRGIWATRRKRR
ncbi:MAG: thermonuclease family protein, partial [Pseudomonadota bacterium]